MFYAEHAAQVDIVLNAAARVWGWNKKFFGAEHRSARGRAEHRSTLPGEGHRSASAGEEHRSEPNRGKRGDLVGGSAGGGGGGRNGCGGEPGRGGGGHVGRRGQHVAVCDKQFVWDDHDAEGVRSLRSRFERAALGRATVLICKLCAGKCTLWWQAATADGTAAVQHAGRRQRARRHCRAPTAVPRVLMESRRAALSGTTEHCSVDETVSQQQLRRRKKTRVRATFALPNFRRKCCYFCICLCALCVRRVVARRR